MSGSHDMTVRLWDAQGGGQVRNPLQGHTSSVYSVAFSLDGRHIVSGSSDRTIRLWDAQTGGQVGYPLQGHTSSVYSVAFSPDGRHIVSSSDDSTVRLWDAQTGGQIRVFQCQLGHTSFTIKSVAFSPDGRHIVSGSDDSMVQLWSVQMTGGQMKNYFQGHSDLELSIIYSSDEQHNVLNSSTKTIQSCSDIQTLDDTTVESVDKSLHGGMIKCKPTFVALSPIHFSSSTGHALHNAQNLFFDLPDVMKDSDSRDLVYLQDDGWIVGPNEKLLLWIPFSYHSSFHYTPWTKLVFPKGRSAELDLSRMAHGSDWSKCYLPIS